MGRKRITHWYLSCRETGQKFACRSFYFPLQNGDEKQSYRAAGYLIS
jgi:hypothetical protein